MRFNHPLEPNRNYSHAKKRQINDDIDVLVLFWERIEGDVQYYAACYWFLAPEPTKLPMGGWVNSPGSELFEEFVSVEDAEKQAFEVACKWVEEIY